MTNTKPSKGWQLIARWELNQIANLAKSFDSCFDLGYFRIKF